jgi:hypothetical protein
LDQAIPVLAVVLSKSSQKRRLRIEGAPEAQAAGYGYVCLAGVTQ